MSTTKIVDPARAAESNLPYILGVTGAVHGVALIIAALRIYARVVILKAAGKDDLTMALCILCTFGGMLCFILQGYVGLGKHQDTIAVADKTVFDHIAFFQSLISAMAALGLLKISIAFSLLRLSTNKWYSRSLWALIGFVVTYTILAWLTLLLQCTPMSGFWDKSTKPQCYSILLFIKFGLANTGFNIFTDVCFATLPIPIIMNLQLKLRVRIYLIIILSLGYFAVALGVVKAYFQIRFATDTDKTFTQSIQFYGFLQLNVGIIAACAPTLKPIVGKALKLSSYGTYGNYNDLSKYGNPARATGRSGGLSRSRPADVEAEFEMHRRPFANNDESYRTSIKGGQGAVATGSVYPSTHGDGDRSGSEEYILQGARNNGKNAIVMTTEITVQK
ncbi:hypothetical protein JX265_012283 [Neoarthrinium moseri]|uniref:Rhodopsin domain-containing protein n=1 Tax=Neoarthrinium moseri TaxID=1658444 RepID=A0A9Q0AIP4_9PEZI|nr:hypothetical protein JX265_012283 [Neoarthrinium moseri]